MNRLRRFPARKCFGTIMGSLAAVFGILFLVRSFWSWTAVPDGVLGLIGALLGGFGGYMLSSSYEATHGEGGNHEDG